MDPTQVAIGKPNVAGALFTAPVGTEVPADAATPLAAAFEEMGYASEDGLKNSFDESFAEVKAWGAQVVASSLESSKEYWEFTAIETNEVVAKEYFGSENVTEKDGVIHIVSNSKEKVAHPWAFEVLLSSTRKMRVTIESGKVVEIGELEYKDGTPVGYKIKIQALPGKDGNRAHRYIAEAAPSAPEA